MTSSPLLVQEQISLPSVAAPHSTLFLGFWILKVCQLFLSAREYVQRCKVAVRGRIETLWAPSFWTSCHLKGIRKAKAHHCGIACAAEAFGDMSAPRQVQMDSIDETQVIVHHACCCCYDGCVPECSHIGCAAQKTLLCCEADICCKTDAPLLCCGCCAIRCVAPTTCCKVQSQICCCVAGSALPPDSEVPCMVNMCFLNCFPRLGICVKLGDMKKGSTQFYSEGSA